jgi:hypothetical protein
VVGDRLDTDIEGAVAAGADNLLVLTGLTTPTTLLAARPGQRPTYVARGLGGLVERHPEVHSWEHSASCRGYTASMDQGILVLRGAGSDDLDALRAMCAACWGAEQPALAIQADGTAAARALRGLEIDAKVTREREA